MLCQPAQVKLNFALAFGPEVAELQPNGDRATHLRIQRHLKRVIYVDQALEVTPAQLSPQRGDNSFAWKALSETDHMTQILGRKSAAVGYAQLSPPES